MRRSRLATSAVALPVIALLLGLGTWQLERRAWKEALIASMAARTEAAPLPLDTALSMAPAEREWRRATTTGRFLHDRQVALYRVSLEGQAGYHVLTPLDLGSGRHVVVNRGFVPEALADPALRPGSEPAGELTVTGVLRGGEARGAFTNDNDPGRGGWYWIDLEALSRTMGVTLLPVVIHADAGASGTWPRAGQARFRPRNDHLNYALTWYGLAAAALVIYVLLLLETPRRTGFRP